MRTKQSQQRENRPPQQRNGKQDSLWILGRVLESNHKINIKGHDPWCGCVWAVIGLILAVAWCYATEREREQKDKEERNRVETHDMSLTRVLALAS